MIRSDGFDGGTETLTAGEMRGLFGRAVDRIVPRILTQVNRDPNDESFGSFDRDWWHYRIRDFSSIILQQGAYALTEAAKLERYAASREGLERIAAGGARFWNVVATRRGAFEEYYPWERGYPPLVFSTLAVGKLARDGVVTLDEISAGIQVAVKQLESRFEAKAGNQQVAGLAALGLLRQIAPDVAGGPDFDDLADRTLRLQHEEGWFAEYGGPDLGYLSVAMDCLWDLFDATGEERYLESARKALRFVSKIVHAWGGSPGMLNARNTDYIVPYGIVRFALADHSSSEMARALTATLYRALDAPSHFLAAIDDRYLTHYVGHSFVRASRLLEAAGDGESWDFDLGMRVSPGEKYFPGCGYLVLESDSGMKFLGALKKGGVFTWADETRSVSDFGWLVKQAGNTWFNHWWSADWETTTEGRTAEVRGRLFAHRNLLSGPFKHFVLRVLSFALGSRIIGYLKSRLILMRSRGSIGFRRVLTIGAEELVVEDHFVGMPGDCELVRAPRASKRHVASADSFHPEDLALARGVRRAEERVTVEGRVVVRTRYTCGSTRPDFLG